MFARTVPLHLLLDNAIELYSRQLNLMYFYPGVLKWNLGFCPYVFVVMGIA